MNFENSVSPGVSAFVAKMRVRAAQSRDGLEVYGDHVNMQPKETRTILLQVQS